MQQGKDNASMMILEYILGFQLILLVSSIRNIRLDLEDVRRYETITSFAKSDH